MKEDQFDKYYEEETYSRGLDREQTIEKQVNIVVYFYSRGFWDEFEYAVKGLLSLLPMNIRSEFDVPSHDITTSGIEEHYQLFTDIQEKLECDTNMIFKKKFIKTYQ